MKKKSPHLSAFFYPRVFISFLLLFGSALLFLGGFGISAQGQAPKPQPAAATTDGQSDGAPDVIHMEGPYSEDRDLRDLPYGLPNMEEEDVRLMRHPLPFAPSKQTTDPLQVVKEHIAKVIAMPTPIQSFPGLDSVQSGCGCLPPDTNGDVGPNHYIQSVNSSIKIFDKSGNTMNGPNGTTYNSFFSGLASSGTPCGLSQT